jgi:hypothetical protein
MTIKIRGGVERVTVMRPDDTGGVVREKYTVDDLNDGTGFEYAVRDRAGRVRRGELAEQLGPAKKQSKLSKAVDKRIHKLARGNLRTVSRYLTLHDRSNRLKKNGWFKDLGKNLRKARRKP